MADGRDAYEGSLPERVERLESVVCSLEEALALTRRDLMYASQRHRAEMDELQAQLRNVQNAQSTYQAPVGEAQGPGWSGNEYENGFGDGYGGIDNQWSGPPPYTPAPPPGGPPPEAPEGAQDWEPLANVVDEDEVRRERRKWDGKYDEWDKDWKDWKRDGGKYGRDGARGKGADRWGDYDRWGKDGKGKGKTSDDWKDYRREKKEERKGKDGKPVKEEKGAGKGRRERGGSDDGDKNSRRRRWADDNSDAGAFDDHGSNYGERDMASCLSFAQNTVLIDLSGWGLGDDGLGRWVDWAVSRSWDRPVDEIRLDHNKISDAGFEHILRFVDKVPLGKIKLHANNLGDGAVPILIKIIELGKDPNKPAKREGDDESSDEAVVLRPDGGIPRSPVRELHLSHNQIGLAAAKDLVQSAKDTGLYPYQKGKASIPLWCRMEKNNFAEFPSMPDVCVVDPSLGKRRTCSPYNCKFHRSIHVVSFCR